MLSNTIMYNCFTKMTADISDKQLQSSQTCFAATPNVSETGNCTDQIIQAKLTRNFHRHLYISNSDLWPSL